MDGLVNRGPLTTSSVWNVFIVDHYYKLFYVTLTKPWHIRWCL